MTLSAQDTKKLYIGDGFANAFSTPEFVTADTVRVFLNNDPQPSGFVISGGGFGTAGDVIFSTPPASGVLVSVEIHEQADQTTTYNNFQSNAQVTEHRFDQTVLFSQQLYDSDYYKSTARILPSGGGVKVFIVIPTNVTTYPRYASRVIYDEVIANVTYQFATYYPQFTQTAFTFYIRQTGSYTITFSDTIQWVGDAPDFASTGVYCIDFRAFTTQNITPTWLGELKGILP